jgi:hypothetical protein
MFEMQPTIVALYECLVNARFIKKKVILSSLQYTKRKLGFT